MNQTSLKCKWISQKLCLVESTSNINIKIKITHKVVEDGYKEYLLIMNACWVNQSVFYQVLNAASDDIITSNCVTEWNAPFIFKWA